MTRAEQILQLLKSGAMSAPGIAAKLGCGRPVIYPTVAGLLREKAIIKLPGRREDPLVTNSARSLTFFQLAPAAASGSAVPPAKPAAELAHRRGRKSADRGTPAGAVYCRGYANWGTHR